MLFKKVNIIIFLIVIIGLVVVGILFKKFSSKTDQIQTSKTEQVEKVQVGTNLFSGEINVCKIFPKEIISKMLGKNIGETRNLFIPGSNFTGYHCTYFLEPKKALIIRVRQGKLEKMRSHDELLGWKRKKEASIPFENFLAYDVKNQFRLTELIIDQNHDIVIDFWGVTDLNNPAPVVGEKEAIKFSVDFTNYFKDLLEKQKTFLK